jgi:hypothetical protein
LFLISQEKGKKEKMLGSQSQNVQQHRQDGVACQAVIQEQHGGFLTFFCYVYYKAESLAHNDSLSSMHCQVPMHPSACLNIICHEWNGANMTFFNLFSGISEEFLNIPSQGTMSFSTGIILL